MMVHVINIAFTQDDSAQIQVGYTVYHKHSESDWWQG
jgi:hypothetical protein